MRIFSLYWLLSTAMALTIEESPMGTDAFLKLTEQSPVPIRAEDKMVIDSDTVDGRALQLADESAECYSTRNDRKPNRYCIFDDTPREDTFLVLSCPNTEDDLSQCHCTIGVGEPDEAPNTDTCLKCAFCKDGTLAYDCRNVAEGSCIGRNCRGECVSSSTDPEDLLIEVVRSNSSKLCVLTLTVSTILSLVALIIQ